MGKTNRKAWFVHRDERCVVEVLQFFYLLVVDTQCVRGRESQHTLH